MRAKPTPSLSTSTPAYSVGSHLHCDLIPLSDVRLGNNTNILFAVDAKTSYVIGVPLKNKTTKSLAEGFDNIMLEYNTYGHSVKEITSDDERNFQSVRNYLKDIFKHPLTFMKKEQKDIFKL
jgi:hypothetical protein